MSAPASTSSVIVALVGNTFVTMKAEIRFQASYFASKLEGASAPRSTTALVARTIHLLSDDIDAMERAVRNAIPQARHIDIEIDQTPPPAEDEAASSDDSG